jgi:hypothetical protein
MARINYPEEFVRQTALFKKMKAKHDADGPGSPITPFLTQQGIDLVADDAATDSATDTDLLFQSLARGAEDETQDRNRLFDPVMDRLRGEVQFLKKFYKGNPAELGLWGVTVNGNRIVYPPEFLNLVQLFKDFKNKHDSFGPGTSPLSPYLTQHGIDMPDDLSDVTDAKTKHDSAKQKELDAEDKREERDNEFDPVMDNVRSIAQYLKGLYDDHAKHLGNWGYVVDESPRDAKFRTVTINAGDTKTITQIKLESQLENTGDVPLELHKGDEAGPEPVNLPPEMRFTIKRGWGTTTVVNPDPATNGEVGYITTNIGAG